MLLTTGTSLGNYEIVAALRSGGMATLYLARRKGAAGFSKPVAIKVVHPDLADDAQFIEMFVAEAKLAAHVNDPNVAHVEELAHENGMYFIAMEYVLGGSLAQLANGLASDERALSREVAVRLVADAARGLHAAHEATSERGIPLGIVHRDVSPQNVLVSTKGIVKLIDFGVAKTALRSDTSSLRGKVPYMSPEQASGRRVDLRTDVYALGVILWELLTSSRLFVAENEVGLLNLVQQPKVEAPSRRTLRTIPAALDAVVLRALSFDPDGRPSTAAAFREELFAAEPEAARVPETEIGTLVEECLRSKLVRERGLLDGHNENTPVRPLHESKAIAELIATRTVAAVPGAWMYDAPEPALPEPRRPVPTELLPTAVRSHDATRSLASRVKSSPRAYVVLLLVVILGASAGIFASTRTRAPPTPAAWVETTSTTASASMTLPLPPARAETGEPVASVRVLPPSPIATKPPRRPPVRRPTPNSTGGTSIVHGTPLTAEVR